MSIRNAGNRVVYVVAGEASGDAIGSKLIRALQRQAPGCTFRGVGGPQMTRQGQFQSLFPMHELSFMGLTEVIPKLWKTLGHLRAVAADIRACQPDAVITIDSKGFTFRLLRILNGRGWLYHGLRLLGDVDATPVRASTTLVHYVAPSTWAYTHKYKKVAATAAGLASLFDHMLVLLPFEAPLFQPTGDTRTCVTFVGHPALEDFGDAHALFRSHDEQNVPAAWQAAFAASRLGPSEWLPAVASPALQAHAVHRCLAAEGQRAPDEAPWTICALVGSRENEVRQTVAVVRAAIDLYTRQLSRPEVRVLFPTISAVAPLLERELSGWAVPHEIHVADDARSKQALYQASNVAVAVSGTVVLETTLAVLPTVVVYRANRLTEVAASALARVRHVSLPNILAARELVPEVLFSRCTPTNVAAALRCRPADQTVAGHCADEPSAQRHAAMDVRWPSALDAAAPK
ncbi:lipid-A-disaccharide synthase [Achlya hypogyna]|uniref:lipid-A-disaccharide synthase n=1 Tax=Achlya hypogyna TaxID=1202772 RepID=A0A1V9ZJR4_ACHHY|nr:lipid-A-disaccharide synthase [Achlya hypogyna]